MGDVKLMLRYFLITILVLMVTAQNRRDESEEAGTCRCQRRRAHRRLKRKIEHISFNSCYDFSGQKLLEIKDVTIQPTPVIAPGEMAATFTVEILAPLPEQIQINLDVHKYMFNLPFRVPCANISDSFRAGSCVYRNICTSGADNSVMGARIPNCFNNTSLQCDCSSLQPGTYTIQRPHLIPNINEMFDVLAKGSYRMRAEFVNSRTQVPVGCVQATWTISKVHRRKARDYRNMFGRMRERQRGQGY